MYEEKKKFFFGGGGSILFTMIHVLNLRFLPAFSLQSAFEICPFPLPLVLIVDTGI